MSADAGRDVAVRIGRRDRAEPGPSSARCGVLGGRTVDVDPTGRVRAPDGSWWLAWWIGADDHWHDPARAAATRQERLDGMPVFETRVRVPGGDAVQRLYGVHLGRSAAGGGGYLGDHVVVEVLNRSRLPFALAIALGPCRAVRLRAGAVELDGRTMLRSSRAPSRWATGPSSGALYDLVAAGGSREVEAGADVEIDVEVAVAVGAETGADVEVGEVDVMWTGAGGGDGAVALLWPVAHGAGLRLLVPLDPAPTSAATAGPEPGGRSTGVSPGSTVPGRGLVRSAPSRPAPWPVLPDAEQVARGWRRQIEAGCRVQLPDDALQARLDAARAALCLEVSVASDDPQRLARLVGALAGWGHGEEARAALANLSRLAADDTSPEVQAALLTAAAAYRRATGDGDVATAALDEVARAAAVVHRALAPRRRLRLGIGPGRAGPGDPVPDPALLRAAAAAAVELLVAAGEPAPSPLPPGPVGADAGAVSGCGGLPAPGVPGPEVSDPLPLIEAVHRLLIDAPPGSGPGTAPEVVVGPGWRDAWRGRPLEVHRLRSGVGAVSYAVRWHGARPALLWDVDPSPLLPPAAPRLRAPVLAPGWTARSWRGEALLDPGG